MKKLRILKSILVRTHTTQILFSYLLFILADALVIQIVEPEIHAYGDALWYCYAVISTAGFGDIVVSSLIGKLASVLLTVYSLIVIALITGVIVNYYNQIIQLRQKETIAAFVDKLERLPELSREELAEMSAKAKQFAAKTQADRSKKEERHENKSQKSN